VQNNPVNATDPTGHEPCLVCVIPNLIIEAIGALAGWAPDNLGLQIAESYMSARKDPGNRSNDALNTYAAAGIAIQSEFPDAGLYRDSYASGRGIGQITDAEMATPYGKKITNCGYECGYGIGMPGLNQLNPGVATVAMRRRLQVVIDACSGCSNTDIFIASGLSQTGTSFTKGNMKDLVNGVYGRQKPSDPANPNGATLPWDEFFSQSKSKNAKLPLRKFGLDVEELAADGWYVPDVDWKYINNLSGKK
jgi:hypothetical protein